MERVPKTENKPVTILLKLKILSKIFKTSINLKFNVV